MSSTTIEENRGVGVQQGPVLAQDIKHHRSFSNATHPAPPEGGLLKLGLNIMSDFCEVRGKRQ